MSIPLTCASCRHHHHVAENSKVGECRALPPTRHRNTSLGPVMAYDRTADDLPICGLFRAKVRLAAGTKGGTG